MTGLNIQFVVTSILTTGVAVVMARMGVRKGALGIRRRHCSSCGRLLTGRGCHHCGV